jgi:hypothetical protein
MRWSRTLSFFLMVGLVHSSATRFWVTCTQEDFAEGEIQDVTISSEGLVSIAPKLSLVADSEQKFVWCAANGPKGDIYIGTGDEGKIFKITRSGQRTLLCDLDEPEVLSLLYRHPYLYAGVGPTGTVYRIDARGEAESFCVTEEEYVWDIIPDSRSGLYVATGEKGKVYRVSDKGKTELVYESVDPHVTRLCRHEKSLFAATSGSGLVYEILGDGRARVIYQTEEEEILALELNDGIMWIGANSKEAESSSVYRISPDGTARKVWSCPDSSVYSFSFWKDGLLVGTGNDGRIYHLESSGDVTLLTKCDDSAILSFLQSNGIWIGTGNLGRVYRMDDALADEGALISEAFDSEGLSAWGEISWKAELRPGTRVELSTRSGNSGEVDDTWSDWDMTYEERARIESPEARFIQWKAVLKGTPGVSPVLKEVRIPYLQKNMAPVIEGIVIEDDIEAKVKRISWEVSDPNGDSLLYDVCFRGEQEKRWMNLEKDFVLTTYELQPIFLPDGVYLIRISAKDSPENPQNLFLTGTKVSQPFRVDNTPPKVTIRSAKGEGSRLTVEGSTVDEASPIRRCEYSIDAGEWKYLAPDDAIFDSVEEKFSFSIEGIAKGEHLLVIRGEDDQGNSSMAKKVVRMP